jgi:hypothetical protein
MGLPQEIVDRYVALWNEANPAVRALEIRALWAPDGANFYRDKMVIGYLALEERVAASHDKNVASSNYRFRDRKDARQTHNGVASTTASFSTTRDMFGASSGRLSRCGSSR